VTYTVDVTTQQRQTADVTLSRPNVDVSAPRSSVNADVLAIQGPRGLTGPQGPPGAPGTSASHSFRGYRLAGWTTAATAALPMDTVSWDTDAAYNTSTGVYTCPVAGKYLVSFQAPAQSVAAGNFVQGQLRQNGATKSRNQTYAQAASQNTYNLIVDTFTCAAGDTLEAWVAGSTSMNGLVGELATHLAITWVGA
jgi:hypothetical protein